MDIPTPPTTGAYTLISDTGKLMWKSVTSSDTTTDTTDNPSK
jgi:hypothetical protein